MKLIVILSLLIVICAADFYSQPGMRYFYSYHPYRPRRDAAVGNFSTVENATTNLTIQTPVLDVANVTNVLTNISFSFKGDQVNMVNCSYSYKDLFLSCDGLTGSILCNTTVDFANLDQLSFDVLSFGLKQINFLRVASTLVKYKIRPFKLVEFNNVSSSYLYEYKFPIYGNEIVSFMNNTSFVINNTFDLVCFNQLVGLLNESKLFNQMQSAVNQIFDNIQSNIHLF